MQLLIPAWRFSSTGLKPSQWHAMVQGGESNSAIEFQIFRPTSGVYRLVNGNELRPGSVTGSGSETARLICNSPVNIRVQSGDIVGIRLTSGGDPAAGLGLQYANTTTGADRVDVYYWQGTRSRACNFSLCDTSAGVLGGVTPLVHRKIREYSALS